MKKKLIALLCAISMLATSVVAIAEDAELSQEPAEEVIEQVIEEEQEAPVEETEEPTEEDIQETEETEEQEEVVSEETVEEETVEEEILEENDEIVESAPVMMMSAPAPLAEADKSELEALIADAETITEDMVSDEETPVYKIPSAAFLGVSSALTAAKDVYDDASATQDMVDEKADALAAKLQVAVQEARDGLFEALVEYKGLDTGILDPVLGGEYEAAYRLGKAAFWNAEKTTAELYNIAHDIATKHYAAKNVVTATEKVLSGNVITEADRELYPNIGVDTLPNLSYTWESEQDTGYTKLLNGVGSTPYLNAQNICWGAWDTHGTTNLDFSLGEEAYVTGADFWECAMSDSGTGIGTEYCSDKVEVFTSNNGIEWTRQKSVDVDQSDCPNSLKGTRVDFDDPVKCRYVRVAVTDDEGHQVKYNEVVIRGYRTNQIEYTPFSIEDIDYKTTGSRGKRIISLDGQNVVKVTGKAKNNTGEDRDVVVICAAYKDGDLLDLRFKSLDDVVAYGEEEFSCTMRLVDGTGAELYTYIWDSLGTAKALSPIVAFGIGNHEMADFSADGEGAEFDINEERLAVWGAANGNGTLNDVTLIVLKAGITADNIDEKTDTEKRNAVVYLEQTAPVGGKYRFESFAEVDGTNQGNNNAYVTKPDGEQLFYRLLYLDTNGEDDLLRAFKGSTSETMRSTIDSNEYLIRGLKAVDEIIAKYGRDAVLNSVAGMIVDVEYETSQELVSEILAAVALTDLNNVATKEEVIASIDNYCEELRIADNGLYKKFYAGDAYAEFKEEVSDKFVGQGYASITDFVAKFCEDIIVDMLNDATNYTDVEKVLLADEDYVAGIGFNMTGYKRLTPAKQIRVQKKVMNYGSFADVASVIAAFNTAVANPGTDTQYGGTGGGLPSTPSLGTSIPLSGVTANDMSVFKDLSEAEWARESILALHKKGIVSGMTNTSFAPNEDVTREQFTKMLVSAFELLDSSAECDFEDIDDSAWYYEAVASAVKNGVVFGLSEKSFGVGAKITREDMAVLAYRALVAKGNKVIYDKSQISNFTDDNEISEYAREAVYAMRGNSIMLGRGDNEFQPKARATRAEAAKIIYSIMGK